MTSANQTLFIKLDYANCKPYPLPLDIPDPFSSGIPYPSLQVYPTPSPQVYPTLRYTLRLPSGILYPFPFRYTLPPPLQVFPSLRYELRTSDTLFPQKEHETCLSKGQKHYYHSPPFDLKPWINDNIDTRNVSTGMQRR